MLRTTLMFALAAVLAGTASALAQGVAAPLPVAGEAPQTGNPTKPNAATAIVPEIAGHFVVTCFSCGNNFPLHVATGNLGGFNQVREYGPRCTLPFAYRRDNRPFLCATR